MRSETTNRKPKLPPGFRLVEDDEFVYLYHGDERIAIFSSRGVDPAAIEATAEAYISVPDSSK